MKDENRPRQGWPPAPNFVWEWWGSLVPGPKSPYLSPSQPWYLEHPGHTHSPLMEPPLPQPPSQGQGLLAGHCPAHPLGRVQGKLLPRGQGPHVDSEGPILQAQLYPDPQNQRAKLGELPISSEAPGTTQ